MPVDYEKFIQQLRSDEGIELKEKLQNFLIRFRIDRSSIQVKRQLIGRFLQDIYCDSLNHIAFVDKNDQSFDEENVKEGWEKLVMAKCFDVVFGGVNNEESRTNETLSKKITAYSWIEERHLDISLNFSLGLEIIQAELLRINGFRSPRDKLVILQNVIQLIVDLIQKKSGNESNSDMLLQTLILVIIRANPPNLISNIKYISRFRDTKEMDLGTNQFCMTNLMGAISFIYNMSTSSLTLNEDELSKWPNPQHSLAKTKEELKEFTDQVSGFFGSLFKEVKTTAGEIMQNVSGPSSPKSNKNHNKAKNVPSSALKYENMMNDELEQEKYEMDLAIAMSLSEAQATNNNLIDIDAYSPLASLPTFEDNNDEEILEKSSSLNKPSG